LLSFRRLFLFFIASLPQAFIFFFFPALKVTVMKKPYENMLRSYCSTNEVRSLVEKLIREGFAPLAFTPADFLCFFLFSAEKKEGII
jgi:hypothetical protein